MSKVLVEICAASLTDVETACQAGAGRIELNSAISLGGLTPSTGLLELALARTNCPVVAMCRPRSSGFCYTPDEYDTLRADVRTCLAAGAHGVAFGVLTADRQIDMNRCRELVELCNGCDAVFHRALDLTADLEKAVESLIDCGVTRVMTSGGRESAIAGRDMISRLVQRFGQQIAVLAAGGIRPENAGSLLKTGVTEIHAGPGHLIEDPSQPPDGPVRFDSALPKNPAVYRVVCGATVRQLVDLAARPDSVKP